MPPSFQADDELHLFIFGFDKIEQIPLYFELICSLHIKFPQIKSVQVCAPQNDGDSLKKLCYIIWNIPTSPPFILTCSPVYSAPESINSI